MPHIFLYTILEKALAQTENTIIINIQSFLRGENLKEENIYSCTKSEAKFHNSWSSSVLWTCNRGVSREFCSATFSYRVLPICLNQKQEHAVINAKHEGGSGEIKTNKEQWWCENKFSVALLTLLNNTTSGGLIGNTLLFVRQTWMAALKCRSLTAAKPHYLIFYYHIRYHSWHDNVIWMAYHISLRQS